MHIELPPPGSRRVIGYGAGLAALVTIETSGLKCEMLIDRSAALHGQQISGSPIEPPERLEELLDAGDPDDFFIIVLAWESRSVAAIFTHLSSLGLSHGKHFTDASVLHYGTMQKKLRDVVGIEADPKRFESLRALALYSTINDKSAIAGSWLIQELLHHQLSAVAGDVAEAGVYTGGNSLLTLALAAGCLRDRTYHLLDSFEGFPQLSPRDPGSRAGEFRDVSLSAVRDLFSHFECTQLHIGFFNKTLPALAQRTFALAYIDCDVYEPTLECCEFFYPRTPPGGMLLFHDYWHERPGLPPGSKQPFAGLAQAVDEFAARNCEAIVTFPETTHALLIKGGRRVEPSA